MQYENIIYPLQDKVLQLLEKAGTPFYLTGGTAISRFYFSHRYSDDLDFFCHAADDFTAAMKTAERALINIPSEIVSRSGTFCSFITEGNLKIDFIQDVSVHSGGFKTVKEFSRIDNLDNILSNKLTALIGRNDPKDIADIWVIAENHKVDWRDIFQKADSKAAGVYPPAIAQKLEEFPVQFLSDIKWMPGKMPEQSKFQNDISGIADEILKIS